MPTEHSIVFKKLYGSKKIGELHIRLRKPIGETFLLKKFNPPKASNLHIEYKEQVKNSCCT